MRKARSEKVMVLGIDGLDPNLVRKYINEGRMPNTEKFAKRGAQHKNFFMLGGMPTVTPPMWTSLATGANPNTHGITCFWNQDMENLEYLVYGLDSRKCHAEQMWNVTAEAGIPTLVWHWPGSSWPPTSDSENLYVVDGSNPVGVNMGNASVEWETIIVADYNIKEEQIKDQVVSDNGAGCIINNVDELLDANTQKSQAERGQDMLTGGMHEIILSLDEGEIASMSKQKPAEALEPITGAKGWLDAPKDALEFTFHTSKGMVRRVCLITKNEKGIYDKIAIYKSKKDLEPMFTVYNDGKIYRNFMDDVIKENGEKLKATKGVKILEMSDDGRHLQLWFSAGMDITADKMFHPTSLYHELVANIGYVQAASMTGGSDALRVKEAMLACWDNHCQWQADAILYTIGAHNIKVSFSHLHNVDACGHQLWHYANPAAKEEMEKYTPGYDCAVYQEFMAQTYEMTDRYIGRFLHLLDEDWTIMIVSDHGLIALEEEAGVIGEMTGINVPIMQELGYTILKKDENGNDIREIDWEKTTAIQSRGDHIWINLKGKWATGIVDPADKYELEDKIISDLYNYRHPKTGKRIISLAMRNKDAIVIGMNGPECGDIIFFINEGYNKVHADSWSTYEGFGGTSVAPTFLAAGKGLKEGFDCPRIIRQIDVVPTMAVLLGLRVPAQCEGAPIYQILADEF